MEGVGANVLGSPWQELLHFLVELRSCLGATDVDAGETVTTGAWTDAWPVPPRRDVGDPLRLGLSTLRGRFLVTGAGARSSVFTTRP